MLIHDNVRLDFHKETQRVNNQSHGDNGTSVSAVQLPESTFDILNSYQSRLNSKWACLLALGKKDYPQVLYGDFSIQKK
jgi:hypothetical protein